MILVVVVGRLRIEKNKVRKKGRKELGNAHENARASWMLVAASCCERGTKALSKKGLGGVVCLVR